MERGAILDKAKAIINGERQQQYGQPENSFPLIAAFWDIYLKHRDFYAEASYHVTAKDVALLMAIYKLAREMNGAGKEDNLIDACGYLALAADMSNYKKGE